MWRMIATGLVVFVIAGVAPVRADSYPPFLNFRAVDPTRRYYIVVKRNGGNDDDTGPGTPVTFDIVERKPGSPPVTPASYRERGPSTVASNSNVRVRERDIVLGRGKLARCPRIILISSTGLGFVGLDVRGFNYADMESRDALVVVARDGTVRHRKALIELFSKEDVARFRHTAGGVHWCDGGWIDETRKVVVVLGGFTQEKQRIHRLYRIVDLESGKVREGTSDVIVNAISAPVPGVLDRALELAAEVGPGRAEPDVLRIYSDDKMPLKSRLLAAVALARLGDRRGGDLMKRAALGELGERSTAIWYLPAVIGDEAAPVLCEVVRRSGAEWSPAARQAMHDVGGRAAVPALVRMLREGHCSTCMDFAVECLGIFGREAKPAVPDLIKLLENPPKTRNPLRTQQLAAVTLGRMGPDAETALHPLIRLAETYAPEEWEQVRARPPEPQDFSIGDTPYAEDKFVDAICKIRRK
jgi:hypothetical protein